ncbi:MAG TPA: helix-turn-helix domain-containing protein [Paenirhodobacter sp.]
MRVSREQMTANRSRILDEAGRLFRARGFDAVSVAEVMHAAGLTHGGFYGHFKSKDDLITQTLAHGLAKAAEAPTDLNAYLDAYMTLQHCRTPAEGCCIAGLAAETLRQTPEARAEMTHGIVAQITRLDDAQAEGTPTERRRAAIGTWAAMVGAMVLARASQDDTLSEEILTQTRVWIETHDTSGQN